LADLVIEHWHIALDGFLLTFPALFSIVNPFGGALIYAQVTQDWTSSTRAAIAGRIAFFSALVMIIALTGGAYILSFFGISLAALRLAGGFIVADTAYGLLSAPEQREARKQEQASRALNPEESALFPLTIPFTAGPGTISVAVALSANHPVRPAELAAALVGDVTAAILTALLVWATYRWADRLVRALGPSGARTFSRIAAFLLLCIGVQVLIGGIHDVVASLSFNGLPAR
jgi:multiple antibiotic resistance protein